jgi:hypothetical protein
MYKAWVSIGACAGLALLIMCHVFHGLGERVGLDSQQALERAETSLDSICRHHGFSARGMRLISEAAPESGQATWRFDFNTGSLAHPISITVDARGTVREISRRS